MHAMRTLGIDLAKCTIGAHGVDGSSNVVLMSDELERWAKRQAIDLVFIQPGKPMQNGYVERFNRTYREEVLDCYVFETLGECDA